MKIIKGSLLPSQLDVNVVDVHTGRVDTVNVDKELFMRGETNTC